MVIIILVIAATIHENTLKAKGFDVSPSGCDKTKTCCRPNPKYKANETERFEMNYINNNNVICENDCQVHHSKLELCEFKNDFDCNYLFDAISTFVAAFSSKLLLCFAYGSNSKVILSAKRGSEVTSTLLNCKSSVINHFLQI